MSEDRKTAAVTGAYGYLGSLIRTQLEAEGWRTFALVRAPRADDARALQYDLEGDAPVEALRSVRLLVHCAYDLALVRRRDVKLVNVEGTRRLLRAARSAGVERLIVLSSMSAYPGTRQRYGRAKLAIEGATHEVGGCSLRPGVVYGEHPGGMAGTLARTAKLPVVPVIAGERAQYFVHEEDFVTAVSAVVGAPTALPGPISVAHPEPVGIREFVQAFAGAQGGRCRFLPVPWQAVYAALRATELLGARLPFRSDSLLGLVRPAPRLEGADVIEALGVRLRPFELHRREQ